MARSAPRRSNPEGCEAIGKPGYAAVRGVAGCVLGFHAEEYFFGPLLLAAAIYLVSLYLGGRAWDGQVRRVAVARAAAKAA